MFGFICLPSCLIFTIHCVTCGSHLPRTMLINTKCISFLLGRRQEKRNVLWHWGDRTLILILSFQQSFRASCSCLSANEYLKQGEIKAKSLIYDAQTEILRACFSGCACLEHLADSEQTVDWLEDVRVWYYCKVGPRGQPGCLYSKNTYLTDFKKWLLITCVTH